jgi:hypothetical protein
MEVEDIPPMLPIPTIFPFELSPKVTFPPLVLVRLEKRVPSPVMCLEQALSKNHSPCSLGSYKTELR